MEFADQSEDEHMPEEVELISKRPQRASSPAEAVGATASLLRKPNPAVKDSPTSYNTSGANTASSKRPIGIALLIICIVAFSTWFGMMHNADDSGEKPYQGETDEAASFAPYRAQASRIGLHAAADRIAAAMARIEKDWRVDEYPVFKSLVHIPDSSWNLQVNKLIVALLRERGAGHPHRFVAVFTGSSVTAGHDNFISEMFSAVFDATLSPVFKALNMDLETRNVAIGNNPCIPYDACVAAHAGEDPDLIAWEQSMNCGRQPDRLEFFIRNAFNLRNKPGIFIGMSGTPVWDPDDCGAVNQSASLAAPRPRSALSPEEVALADSSYRKAAEASSHLLNMPFLKAGGGMSFSEYYYNAGLIGVNVLPIGEYKCKGPYNRDFCTKSPGPGKKWHPGVLGHKLRGDAMSFAVLAMLRDSVQAVQAVADSDSDELTVSPTNALGGLWGRSNQYLEDQGVYLAGGRKRQMTKEIDLPPVRCSADDCEAPPACFTDFEPRYLPESSIRHLVVGSDEALYAPGAPKSEMAPGHLDAYSLSRFSTWNSTIAWTDIAAVKRIYSRPETRYYDLKRISMSSGEQGSRLPLHLEVVRDQSSIWFCEVNLGVSYPPEYGRLDTDATIYVKTNVEVDRYKELAAAPTDQLGKVAPLSLVFDSECFKTSPLPPGQHMVTIVQAGSKLVNLAYILHW